MLSAFYSSFFKGCSCKILSFTRDFYGERKRKKNGNVFILPVTILLHPILLKKTKMSLDKREVCIKIHFKPPFPDIFFGNKFFVLWIFFIWNGILIFVSRFLFPEIVSSRSTFSECINFNSGFYFRNKRHF